MTQEELNEKASEKVIIELLQDVRYSFAPRSDEFFGVIMKMIIEKGYNGRQLKRGLSKMIQTCEYNQLSVSAVIKYCDEQNPQRFVEYSRISGNGSWQTVTFPESVYVSDCSVCDVKDKPKLIKYID